jgi:hypothetical protein
MADFCWECSKEMGFSDGSKNDLSGLITEQDHNEGYVSSVVICEGCGPIQVDHLGHCVSEDCDGHHRVVDV